MTDNIKAYENGSINSPDWDAGPPEVAPAVPSQPTDKTFGGLVRTFQSAIEQADREYGHATVPLRIENTDRIVASRSLLEGYVAELQRQCDEWESKAAERNFVVARLRTEIASLRSQALTAEEARRLCSIIESYYANDNPPFDAHASPLYKRLRSISELSNRAEELK